MTTAKQKNRRAFALAGGSIAAVLGGLALFAGTDAYAADDEVDPPPPPPPEESDTTPVPGPSGGGDRKLMLDWARRWQFPEPFIAFLDAKARGESGHDARVYLGQYPPPSAQGTVRLRNRGSLSIEQFEAQQEQETWAAKKGFSRNLDKHYLECTFTQGANAQDYTFGSGGLFGMLPNSAVAAFWNTEERCINPVEAVFEVGPALICAWAYAARTIKNREWDGSLGELAVAWRMPSAVGPGDSQADVKSKNKLDKALSSLGYSYTSNTTIGALVDSQSTYLQWLADWRNNR